MSYLEWNRIGMTGMGQASDETPEVKQLPWDIGKDREPTREEIKTQRWERASLYLGVLGAFTGLLLALPEIRRMIQGRGRRGR